MTMKIPFSSEQFAAIDFLRAWLEQGIGIEDGMALANYFYESDYLKRDEIASAAAVIGAMQGVDAEKSFLKVFEELIESTGSREADEREILAQSADRKRRALANFTLDRADRLAEYKECCRLYEEATEAAVSGKPSIGGHFAPFGPTPRDLDKPTTANEALMARQQLHIEATHACSVRRREIREIARRALAKLQLISQARLASIEKFKSTINEIPAEQLRQELIRWIDSASDHPSNEHLQPRAGLSQMTIKDRAIQHLQNAAGQWVTSVTIGEAIGAKAGTVKAKLNEAKTAGLPIESSQAGFIWKG